MPGRKPRLAAREGGGRGKETNQPRPGVAPHPPALPLALGMTGSGEKQKAGAGGEMGLGPACPASRRRLSPTPCLAPSPWGAEPRRLSGSMCEAVAVSLVLN